MSESSSTPASLFVDHVKEVLESLYDFAFLERHPFAAQLNTGHLRTGETSGQCLRRLILSAIERLNPGTGLALRSAHARAYNMLHLRYVEGMTTHEAANEIGVSKRQAYRHLVSAREDLAALLQSLYPELTETAAVDQPAVASFSAVKIDAQPVDLSELVVYAKTAVARLAEQNDLTLSLDLPAVPVTTLTDSTIAKQVLVSILSRCVQQAEDGPVQLILQGDQIGWQLHFDFPASESAAMEQVVSSITGHLVHSLGWYVEYQQSDEVGTIRLYSRSKVIILLVIDDDEGLGALIERYLTGQPYHIVVALSGEEGLEMVDELQPDVVVLDVMMPHMDGWEVLQRIKARPETHHIDVVLCSIFNDPELAYSLGAAYVLAKPLTQADFLEALHSLDLAQV